MEWGKSGEWSGEWSGELNFFIKSDYKSLFCRGKVLQVRLEVRTSKILAARGPGIEVGRLLFCGTSKFDVKNE